MFRRERERKRKRERISGKYICLADVIEKEMFERGRERERENNFPPHSSSEVPLAIYFELEKKKKKKTATILPY